MIWTGAEVKHLRERFRLKVPELAKDLGMSEALADFKQAAEIDPAYKVKFDPNG